MSNTKNKLADLNNHLFEQLERLNDDELSGEELEKEIQRAKAMTDIAGQIIASGKLAFEAYKYQDEFGHGRAQGLPAFLEENGGTE